MTHLDLFSGIGGFAYAADQVWDDIEHIFCDNDKFCQQVLRKHWPESEIYDDIRTITADSDLIRRIHGEAEKQPAERPHQAQRQPEPSVRPSGVQLLTGGFPCQPFSQAGLRRGTADDRHLWPEMLRVIRLTEPEWVIAENVGGLVTWNDGMVLEQVCTDLEAAGYEVQPFIIPAVATNAPHRRDRIWFIGHAKHYGQYARTDSLRQAAADSDNERLAQRQQPREASTQAKNGTRLQRRASDFNVDEWERDWMEVAAEFCSVDDGLPVELDELKLTKAGHRKEQIKAYGNAIVPQVAIEIMRAMKPPKAKE